MLHNFDNISLRQSTVQRFSLDCAAHRALMQKTTVQNHGPLFTKLRPATALSKTSSPEWHAVEQEAFGLP